MTRRTALPLGLALLASLALAACGAKHENTGAPATSDLRLVLDYLPNADHVGIYSARARGDFRRAGLNVQIQTPSDPSAPLKLLIAGKADLAISYQPEVLLARDKGARILSVGAVATEPLTSLMSVNNRPVSPKTLAGKRVGTAGIPYQDAYLDEILQTAGVDPGAVKRVNVGFNLVPAMLSGRVDATLGAFWNIEGVQLALQHKRPRILPVDRVGVPTYDELVLVARIDTVERHGALIRRFLQALQRGTRAARADPEAAAGALVAAAPDIKRPYAVATVRATLPALFPQDPKDPFGWQDPAEWNAYKDWMERNSLLTQPANVGQALTNEFLPGQGVGQDGATAGG
ncbi:MAG TPA: ABC transporter substrate-binding protein [Solirubrobacteraceae bacterium]